MQLKQKYVHPFSIRVYSNSISLKNKIQQRSFYVIKSNGQNLSVYLTNLFNLFNKFVRLFGQFDQKKVEET